MADSGSESILIRSRVGGGGDDGAMPQRRLDQQQVPRPSVERDGEGMTEVMGLHMPPDPLCLPKTPCAPPALAGTLSSPFRAVPEAGPAPDSSCLALPTARWGTGRDIG